MNLDNKRVCVTGRLQYGTRDIVHQVLREHGAHIDTSVTRYTNILICGDSPGSKLSKARAYGIEVWDEQKLMSIFGEEINILILDIDL